MMDEDRNAPRETSEDNNEVKQEDTVEEEYILDEHRNKPEAIGCVTAFFHLTKTAIGTGIVAVPWAFKQSGTVGGFMWTAVLGTFAGNSHYQLVNCAQNLSVRLRVPSLLLPDLAEQCFRLGSTRIQKFALVTRHVTNTFILVSLFGTCAVYLIFAAKHIKQVLDYHTESHLDIRIYLCLVTIVATFVDCIRNLSHLMPISVAAILGQFTGLSIAMYYVCTDLPPFQERPYFVWDVTKLTLFMGTVMFSVQGIITVSAIEAEMRHPKQMIACPCGALFYSFLIIIIATAICGFFGYWKYEDPQGSMILNLPINETAAQVAKIMYGGGVILSHPLCFYVPFNIVWNGIKNLNFVTRLEEHKVLMLELLYRVIWVFFTGAIAISAPVLGALINVIGAVAISALSFVLAPFINLLTFWDQCKFAPWIQTALRAKDCILILIGLILFFMGTYVSIINFIDEINKLKWE